MKIALIRQGFVENIIIADSLEVNILFPNHTCIDITYTLERVDIGSTFDGVKFTTQEIILE